MNSECNYKKLQSGISPTDIDCTDALGEPSSVARRTKELGPAIGRRVKTAREQTGLSVRRVGELVGASPNTIFLIERGDGGNSGIGLLVDLARVLRVAPDWLVFGDPSADRLSYAISQLSSADRRKLLAELHKSSD